MVRFDREGFCRFCKGDHTEAVPCEPRGSLQIAQISVEDLEALIAEDIFLSIGDRRQLVNMFKELRKTANIPDAPIYNAEARKYDLELSFIGRVREIVDEITQFVATNGKMAALTETKFDAKLAGIRITLKL